MNFGNIWGFFPRREWFISYIDISMPISVMEPKPEAFLNFSGRAVADGSPFLLFANTQIF